MNTHNFPRFASILMPKGWRTRSSKRPDLLLWVSCAFAFAFIVFAVALIAAKLLPSDVIAVEIEPAVIDPFFQHKLDAKQEELTAQF